MTTKRPIKIHGDVIDLTLSSSDTNEDIQQTFPSNKRLKSVSAESKRRRDVGEDVMGKVYLTRLPFGSSTPNVPELGITDLLQPRDRELEWLAQFNFEVDLHWFMGQMRPVDIRRVPVLVYHGLRNSSEINMVAKKYPTVKLFRPDLPIPYGTHHTKMMILVYKDQTMRIVVHTANLRPSDWGLKTQALWTSPFFPLKDSKDLNSQIPGRFQVDLTAYLEGYGLMTNEVLKQVGRFDMRKCKAVLVGSLPGSHSGGHVPGRVRWGHARLRDVLPKSNNNERTDQMIAQFSSIGSLGPSSDAWLTAEFLESLSTGLSTNGASKLQSSLLKLVFPTVEEVRNSLEGYDAGNSIPYDFKNHMKQAYLRQHFHHWQAEKTHRSRAMPHIKTYMRVSADGACIRWFLLTSANLSKAAWGTMRKKDQSMYVRSYELGVLLIDGTKADDGSEFHLINATSGHDNVADESLIRIPIPYDLPLKPYTRTDEPWTWNLPRSEPDIMGRTRVFD